MRSSIAPLGAFSGFNATIWIVVAFTWLLVMAPSTLTNTPLDNCAKVPPLTAALLASTTAPRTVKLDGETRFKIVPCNSTALAAAGA